MHLLPTKVLRYEPPHQRQTTLQRKGQPALVNFGDELIDLAEEIAAFKVTGSWWQSSNSSSSSSIVVVVAVAVVWWCWCRC